MNKLIKQSINAANVLFITVLSVISIIVIISYQVHQSYKQTWESTKTVNKNILLTVANILENNFKTIQLSLESTKEKIVQLQNNNEKGFWLENNITIEKNLFNDLSLYNLFGSEVILDENGLVLYTSSDVLKPYQSFADRDYYYMHKLHDDLGLYFGKPFYSRIDNQPSMPLSMRYNKADDSFGGVIVQTLKINEINRLFSEIELGESAGLNLLLRDGTPIILFSFTENIFDQTFVGNEVYQTMSAENAGNLSAKSPVDKEDRFYSFLSLEKYPLIISVVQNNRVITKKWRAAATWALVLTFLMMSIIAILVFVMYKQVKINRLAAIKLDSEKESFKVTLEAIKDAVLVVDKHSHVVYLNPSAEHLIGVSLRNAVGRVFTDLFSIYDEQKNQIIRETNIHKAIRKQRFVSAVDNRVLINQNDVKYPIEITVSPLFVGEVFNAVVAVLHDVSIKRDQVNKMRYLAQQDALTGLPNRRYLVTMGEESIKEANTNNTLVGLLFMDLDGFKNANDTLGHAGGDEILIQITSRFKSVLRADDILVRNGGDEFIVLVSKLHKEQELVMLAERIIKITQKEFKVLDKKINITTSIGISIYPKHVNNLSDLVEYADQAMYAAKNKGRNCYHIYE